MIPTLATLALAAGTARFVPGEPAVTTVVNDPADVAAVAADALRYLRESPRSPGAVLALPSEDVEATLALATSLGDGLADPARLAACFRALRWEPDSTRWSGQLRLTRYLVFEVEGRAGRDAAHPYALYALPDDEAGLTEVEADARKGKLSRFRYTRPQVRDGVYLPGGEAAGRARPLVWLSLEDHEQALMQGTVSVRVPGEATPRLFNVHRPNGIPWDRALAGDPAQPRLWYFRETDAVRGYGAAETTKIALRPFAAVAGDPHNVGVGTLLALRSADGWRLVVLADTGGAFEPNLHQLDLFTGTWPSKAAFARGTAAIGDTAEAWVLVARPAGERGEACAAAPGETGSQPGRALRTGDAHPSR